MTTRREPGHSPAPFYVRVIAGRIYAMDDTCIATVHDRSTLDREGDLVAMPVKLPKLANLALLAEAPMLLLYLTTVLRRLDQARPGLPHLNLPAMARSVYRAGGPWLGEGEPPSREA